MTPYTPSQLWIYSSTTGGTGSTGGGADCNQAWEDEGKPGDGGTGGTGTAYSYTNGTSINSVTGGSAYNTGIMVQSNGGTGGTGGYGSTCYGGRGGGSGGTGGAITVSNGSSSSTPNLTLNGTGIIAISQGGQGGTGGNTNSTYSAGNGGYGGTGGTVTLSNYGTISTAGTYAFGLYGLSEGGGGGNGGTNKDSVYGSGGDGMSGGVGGQVYLSNYGTISTTNSYAMFGISVGGYGGNAGSSNGFVPAPTSGAGYGGVGGNVTLNNSGTLTTNGVGQAAMVGISVGGGGGDAGRQSSLSQFGANGGPGAQGGNLTINNWWNITTLSTASVGIAAVSVGGGGGSGGMSSSAFLGGGGSGGGGGYGGNVEVSNSGFICTGGNCSSTQAVTTGNGLAPAIAALSVGGGGGMGGYSQTAGVVGSVGVGGQGGDGGAGGKVWVINGNTLRTTEITSAGILAASVGGGGGAGGGAFSAAAGSVSMAVAVGGKGGSGGAGGIVGVNCGESSSHSSSSSACSGAPGAYSPANGSIISTLGTLSPGILAMSVGGGGGAGGFAVSLAESSSMAASISVGGSGGSGGAGGSVYANTAGVKIQTSGEFSSGLEALSIGGGGGHGGMTMYTPDYLPGGAVAPVSVGISVGGSGGSGGAGGAVMAENIGSTITTNSERADGIFAASVGGRGGHGGLASAGAAGLALSATTSIGGNGGSGNTGGAVTVYNTSGAITTYGQDSHAIEAMSIGGGGGSGGWSAGAGVSLGSTTSFTVGGNGGSGGNSGAVNVTNSGVLSVNGTGGAGILALSIGGGGGNGGSSASADVALNGAFTATVGGSGTGGATAGSVNVTNSGKILTGLGFSGNPASALGAQGIAAMSIGGGGGRGGIAVTGDVTGSGSLSGTVGGGSGSGGTGGAVAVTNQSQIVTLGDLSNGILGISTGGRGGLGGIAIGGSVSTGNAMNDTVGSNGGNGGHGGTVNLTNNGSITTGGFRTAGMSAQSMGGHGGMGGIALGATLSEPSNASSTVTLGGSGGHGGVGGTATVTNNPGASISSTGPFSAGLIAQSLGGDGGIGGIGIGAATSIISPSMTLGGSGGSGADGGSATSTSNGTITTTGLNSIGQLAQSIGGNGGLSGVTIAGLSSDRAGQFGMNLGNSGGSGANGGSATSNEGGYLSTSGALSSGIVAESIGGGGGRAGAVISMNAGNLSNLQSGGASANVGSTGGGGGNGGSASITQNGNVTTVGVQSDNLYAGSIGGGGGSAGFSFLNMTYGTKTINLSVGGQGGSDGNGGTVNVSANQNQSADTSHTISSSGAFSNGIYAQSVGGGGGAATGLHSLTTAGGMFEGLSRLGSTGGSGGTGGTVNLNTGGALYANGIGSTGILGQSIGGGGGLSLAGLIAASTDISIPGTNIQFTVGSGSAGSATGSAGSSTSAPSTSISLVPGSSSSITAGSAASMQLGGFSSASGNGGAVNMISTTQITTVAALSDGIKLQSIGGGGGFSGVVDSHSGSPFAGASMFLGGGGSGGGSGGNINLNSSSDLVSTSGALSTAILAQSIGGGGGDSRLVSLAATGLTSGFAASHGVKSGSDGGSGGVVTVNVNYQVLTSGIGSDAIVAQSIGGGGGFSALYGGGTTAPAFASSSSGVAGQSQAGMMSSVSAGSSTSASYAGSANNNSNMGGSISTIMGASMAGVLGASGGTGNNGNTVTVTNNGWVYTGNNSSNSDGSAAIIAQSIGAGGGIVREHLSNFDQSQTSMSLMLGAIGSANGFGGNVTVSNNYTSSDSGNWVNTFLGKGSIGILAQSIGGGGGLGMLTETTVGRGGSANLSLSLGGAGSSNGGGGTVIVNNGGHLQTSGDQAEAIIAQSISSGGGVAKASIYAASSGGYISSSAPFSAYSSPSLVTASAANGMAIGAKLGSNSTDNSNAGAVTVNNIGAISTEADLSKAIVAQSISGGGGVVDVTGYGINTSDFIASVNMGGSAPGTVGAVTVNAGGTTITTSGNLADAIVAQSITFGGGIFGAIDWNTNSSSNSTINYQLGSPGMTSSPSASAVSVTAGNITTTGYGSSAITAQSIGGGGGLLGYVINTGAMNGSGILGSEGTTSHTSAGYTVSVSTNGSLATSGQFAPAIIAQSIGGGGGRVIGNQSQDASTLRVGGQGGGGGSNIVNVTTGQSIATGGANSPGIIAQSIGGGGGILNAGDPYWINVILGGYSASSSTVNIESNGSIWTGAQGSAGIIAQSIGGGGGLVTMNGYPQFGGTTTTGSNAGSVNVSVNGTITTNGNAAPGVIATSIGGGGGLAIQSDNAAQSYSSLKGRGNGGNVTVDVYNPITTYGSGSDGVVAVSIGGGGGVVISSIGVSIPTSVGTGSAGSVTVNNKSSIHTYGANTTAIYAKALKGNEDPQVNMAVGSSAIGGAGGTGIFLSGAINVVNNSGYIGTLDGVTGRSIVSDMGTTTVNNSGTTVGAIHLGGSGNVINNLAAGRMYVVNHPDIGVDGVLNNSGFLQYNPQGLLGLGAISHQGTLIQSSGGVLGIKFDHQAGAADLINLGSSSYFELGGSISPTLINAGLIAPGSAGLTTIINNNGGTLIHDQLGVVNTAIMNYGLVKDSSGVQLTSTANFAPAGLSPYASQVGSAIGSYQTAGSNAFFQAATAQLVNIPTVGALDQAYNSLAGSAIQAMPQANYQAVTRAIGTVSDRMNSWRVGDSFIATTKNPRALMTGAASMNQPITPNAPQVANGTLSADGGQLPITSLEKSTDARTWITPFGGTSNSNNLADQIYGGSLGIEAQSDDRKFIGGAAMTISQSNYTYSSATTPATPGSATNYGAQFYFGARGDSAYLSAIGYLGGSSGNFTRQLQTLGFNTTSGVNVHSNIMGARVEAGYNLLPNPQGKATLQVTPFVAIQPTQIRQNGANENFGSLGSGFYYGSNINTAVPVYLGAEFSGDVAMGHNEVLKPFLRVSWAHDLMNNPMVMGGAITSAYGPTLYANGTPSMGNMVILKGGAKYNWGTKVSAYATIDVEQGNAAYSYRGIGGSVGAIYSW